MTAAQHPDFVFYLLALILPLSALLTRRAPLKQSLIMAGAWVGIFLVGVLIVGATRDIPGSWTRFTSLLSDDEQHVSGSAVRLRMAISGRRCRSTACRGAC